MATRLFDTHAHLTLGALAEDVPGVLERARAHGVFRVITVGTDVADSRRAVELASACDGVSATVGIHPHEASKVESAGLDELGELARHPRIVAMGEMGLDYYYDHSDRVSQRRVFAAQLELAQPLELPLVIHCREAVADAVALLCDHGFDGRRVVFHCFTGTADEARQLADHGWQMSFTGIVTFRKSTELQAVAREYPADRLMLETDAPYLSPEPVRSVRPNEPSHLPHTARFLARLRDEPLERLASQTTRNAEVFFGIPEDEASLS
ncbi:MAG: TatD family hydrolase [bacterium]|nr:TatD family hydrolase [bacterium]